MLPTGRLLSLRVGFFFLQNHINPAMDFTQTPPGMLALDNMLYLAKVHQDTYIRVKAGASSQSCAASLASLSHLPSLFRPRLSWRTAAEKTNMNVPLAAVPSSSPKCSVKSCRLGNYVSLQLPLFLQPFLTIRSLVRLKVMKLDVSGTGQPYCAFF